MPCKPYDDLIMPHGMEALSQTGKPPLPSRENVDKI